MLLKSSNLTVFISIIGLILCSGSCPLGFIPTDESACEEINDIYLDIKFTTTQTVSQSNIETLKIELATAYSVDKSRFNVNRTYSDNYATIEIIHSSPDSTDTAYSIYQKFMVDYKDPQSKLRQQTIFKNIDPTFTPKVITISEIDEYLLYPSTFVFHYNAEKSITQHEFILASPGYGNKSFEIYKMDIDRSKLWLTITPIQGIIKPGQALQIDVIVDFKKLENNLDYTTIKIYHNGYKQTNTISIMAFKGELEYKTDIKEGQGFWERLWAYRLEDDAVSTSISALVMILVLEVFIFIFYYCCCSLHPYNKYEYTGYETDEVAGVTMDDYKHKIDMRQVINRKTSTLTPESTQKPTSIDDKIETTNPNFYQSINPDVKMRETTISHSKSQ